jgi:hypothetical protein
MMRTLLSVASVALCGSAAACSPADSPPELTTIDMISVNGLSVQALAAGAPEMSALAEQQFGAPTALAQSSEGRSLLSYIAACALPANEMATVELGGGPVLPLNGRLGLAPQWRQGALDESGKRWVSACVLAHVNAFSIPVPMSVRSVALGPPTPEEELVYDVQEAAFYGNLFTANPADREMNACFGYHVAAQFGYDGDIDEDSLDYLHYRVCSTHEACGFNRVGACYDWGPPILGTPSRACDQVDGSFYLDCHEKPVAEGAMKTWPETVTVHLKRADLDRQFQEFMELDRDCVSAPNMPLPLYSRCSAIE